MSFIAPLRPGRQSRRKLAFALAVSLPVIGIALTEHVDALGATPYSLHLLSVVVVGILGGLAPSLLAILAVEVVRWLLLLSGPDHRISFEFEALHACLLLASALLVWFMNRRRLLSQEKIEATLTALQERTNDLVASLNSNRCACWTLDLDSGRSERWYSGSH